MSKIKNPRVSEVPVDPMFIDRWSPRAFSTEPVPEESLRTLFEAARPLEGPDLGSDLTLPVDKTEAIGAFTIHVVG